MRIEQSSSLSSPVRHRAVETPGGRARFAEALAGDAGASSANAAKAATNVENLFVLQEVSDELAGRRRAVERGSSMLDRLEDVRVALLTGSLPRGQLEALRRLARERIAPSGDPRLAAVLEEIDLRVAVELAKLDKVA